MTPPKFHVAITGFPYGGNGGSAAERPEVGAWIREMHVAAMDHPNIGRLFAGQLNDTPITMTRNEAILAARQMGFDVLVMIDSDMVPDCEPDGKKFWDTSFEFFLKHYDKGPCVVCAPYCGPPPDECVYVFRWVTGESASPNMNGRLEMYPRDMAISLTGIQPVAAVPTGLILFDVRAFELTAPEPCDPRQVLEAYKAGEVGAEMALKLINQHSWCYYEYTDIYQTKKASTEDVTLTRDISLCGIAKLGYNPVYCNWDAWAGHCKTKVVRKPRLFGAEDMHGQMRDAIASGSNRRNRLTVVDPLWRGAASIPPRRELATNGTP